MNYNRFISYIPWIVTDVFSNHVIDGIGFFDDITADPGLWGKALSFLQKRAEPPWFTLKMLFLGTDSHPGIISRADCSQMGPVYKVLEECSYRDLANWVQKLLIMLLQQGLQYHHLANTPPSTPIHSALLIGIKAGGLNYVENNKSLNMTKW